MDPSISAGFFPSGVSGAAGAVGFRCSGTGR